MSPLSFFIDLQVASPRWMECGKNPGSLEGGRCVELFSGIVGRCSWMPECLELKVPVWGSRVGILLGGILWVAWKQAIKWIFLTLLSLSLLPSGRIQCFMPDRQPCRHLLGEWWVSGSALGPSQHEERDHYQVSSLSFTSLFLICGDITGRHFAVLA